MRNLKLLKKVRLRGGLKKCNVLVFGRNSADILGKAVLQGITYEVLSIRHEVFPINFSILFRMILNICRMLSRRLNANVQRDLDKVLRYSYYLACMQYVSPLVVIAFIDNAGLFYDLAESFPRARFIVMQNGARSLRDIGAQTFDFSPAVTNLCFGQYEIDLFEKHGYTTRNFVPIGALRGGYYKFHLAQTTKKAFQICLVSQFRQSVMYGNGYPSIRANHKCLNEYLSKFVMEHAISPMCIAGDQVETGEREYFDRYYDTAHFFDNPDRNALSTYRLMDESEAIISMDSTAAFEAYGWGKKVLFCNLQGLEERSYPLPDMCYMDENNYELFEKKLVNLLAMDDSEYRRENESYFTYFMNYDPQNPPHKYIRDLVLDIIEEK